MAPEYEPLVERLNRLAGTLSEHQSPVLGHTLMQAGTAIRDLSEEVERLRGALRGIGFMRPSGPVDRCKEPRKLVERMERTALDALNSPSRTQPSEAARLREALTPSADTKAAYIGEIKFTTVELDEFGDERTVNRTLEWTTTKEVMAMILARAARSALITDTGRG